MKTITTKTGDTILLDDADFCIVSGLNIRVQRYRDRETKYAAVYSKATRKNEMLHRVILGLSDRLQQVDHINHNGLDNQRGNLRVCTARQNQGNAGVRRERKTSKFKGVYLHRNKWAAAIRDNGSVSFLGSFATEEEAASAYDVEAARVFGQFAVTNAVLFP